MPRCGSPSAWREREPTARAAVAALTKMGLETILITGDNAVTARAKLRAFRDRAYRKVGGNGP